MFDFGTVFTYNILNSEYEYIGGLVLEAIEVAHKAVEAANDKQATDIALLDTRGVCSFADYFVICSGDSERQIKTIYSEIGHILKQASILPHHHDGTVVIKIQTVT